MLTHRSSLVVLIAAMSIIASACGGAQAVPAVASPTETAIPTSTPAPTATPPPTPTVEPPAELTAVFDAPILEYFEGFDVAADKDWDMRDCQSVAEGQLRYDCTDGLLSRKDSIYQGDGVLVDFMHPKQAGEYWWGITLVTGEFGQSNWRSFGIADNNKGAYANVNQADTFPLAFPSIRIKPDVWYRLALAIGENGHLAMLLWERDNPANRPWKLTNTMGEDWSRLKWSFWVNDAQGAVLDIDNFYKFSFAGIK